MIDYHLDRHRMQRPFDNQNMEILVHIAGASSAKDDARYRAQARAYLTFERALSASPRKRDVAPNGGNGQEIDSALPTHAEDVAETLQSSGVATVPISSLEYQDRVEDDAEGGGSSFDHVQAGAENDAEEGGRDDNEEKEVGEGNDYQPSRKKRTLGDASPELGESVMQVNSGYLPGQSETETRARARLNMVSQASSPPLLARSIKETSPQTQSWDPSFTSQDARDMLSFAERVMPAITTTTTTTTTIPEPLPIPAPAQSASPALAAVPHLESPAIHAEKPASSHPKKSEEARDACDPRQANESQGGHIEEEGQEETDRRRDQDNTVQKRLKRRLENGHEDAAGGHPGIGGMKQGTYKRRRVA